MRFCHLSVQEDAAIIEGNALLKIPQLIVDGPNEQQQVCPVCMCWIDLDITTQRLSTQAILQPPRR